MFLRSGKALTRLRSQALAVEMDLVCEGDYDKSSKQLKSFIRNCQRQIKTTKFHLQKCEKTELMMLEAKFLLAEAMLQNEDPDGAMKLLKTSGVRTLIEFCFPLLIFVAENV